MSSEDEKQIVDYILKQKKDVAFERHFYFFDWKKYSLPVNLMNMVRDPVDRVVSHFYFVRSAKRWINREVVPLPSWFTKKFDKCVLTQDPECMVTIRINLSRSHHHS